MVAVVVDGGAAHGRAGDGTSSALSSIARDVGPRPSCALALDRDQGPRWPSHGLYADLDAQEGHPRAAHERRIRLTDRNAVHRQGVVNDEGTQGRTRDVGEPRPYLNTAQLAAVTPWTPEAIKKMVARGELLQGVHWFQPAGPRSTRVFNWQAVRAYIEGVDEDATSEPEPDAARVLDAVSRLLAHD
jgi:hypothetical protein